MKNESASDISLNAVNAADTRGPPYKNDAEMDDPMSTPNYAEVVERVEGNAWLAASECVETKVGLRASVSKRKEGSPFSPSFPDCWHPRWSDQSAA